MLGLTVTALLPPLQYSADCMLPAGCAGTQNSIPGKGRQSAAALLAPMVDCLSGKLCCMARLTGVFTQLLRPLLECCMEDIRHHSLVDNSGTRTGSHVCQLSTTGFSSHYGG